MADIFAQILEHQRRGEAAVLVTVVEKKGHGPALPQGRLLVGREGRLAGTVGGGAIEKRAIEQALALLNTGGTLLKSYLLDEGDGVGDLEPTGMQCGGTLTLFFETLAPAARAYLFGAGHIGLELAPLLRNLGFAPVLIDCRPEARESAPGAVLAAGDDYRTLPELPGLADAFVVIATHGHACDKRVLEGILDLGVEPAYCGLIASTRKWRAIAEQIRGERGADLDLSWIHSPAGLRLGGGTPAEIALSLAAEIQAVRTGKGRHDHMRDPEASS